MPMRFALPYTPEQLEVTIAEAAPRIPESFLWGVATAGYQAEGGYNGPDDPKNNWYGWEGRGGRAVTGRASDFWNRHEEDFERAAGMSLNAFRLSVEWSRVQPTRDPSSRVAPPFDEQAFDAYARIIAAARVRGLEPIVTLHHFTHPLWLGRNLWLDAAKVEDHFVAYVARTVRAINERLVEAHGQAPVRYWVTVNEPFALASGTYLFHVFPGDWDRGRTEALRTCLENVLVGHVLAHRAVHAAYRERGWPRPAVTFNSWASRVYAIDKQAQDVMLARALGVERGRLAAFLAAERARHSETVGRLALPRDMDGARRRVDSFLDAAAWKRFGIDSMPRLVDAVYADDPEPGLLDVLSFDYYDPFLANNVDLFPPSVRVAPWRWNVVPSALPAFLRSYTRPAHGLPIMILENGFSFRGRTARGTPRFDGVRRADGLKAHLYGCLEAIAAGVALTGFCHWTITDNYEWGSFEPRFGLFAVDYEKGSRRLDVDAVGDDAAGAYRRLVAAMRARDPAALLAAFRAR